MKKIIVLVSYLIIMTVAYGQDEAILLTKNAVRIENLEALNDSVYKLLSPFRIILVGEMHGTNEPAQFVKGLAELFSKNGDSVQVGLEIPSDQMEKFFALKTDSSIYQSSFFAKPTFESGRESFAWAGIISELKENPKINIFFFDRNSDESKLGTRDSIMYLKIKKQFQKYPGRRMITLSGNYHNMNKSNTMISYLRNDSIVASAKICSLNTRYMKGACRANFGNGLEVKELENDEPKFDTGVSFDKFIYLVSQSSTYPYTGFYYTKNITPAKMVNGH